LSLTAEKAGTLTTLVAEGDTLAIGAAVARIEEGAAAPVAAAAPAAPVAAQPVVAAKAVSSGCRGPAPNRCCNINAEKIN
jgi:pyruvate/2-oxoglutarate dehydrogenase complex dihydrolipoamide acyltransferase (E2) component